MLALGLTRPELGAFGGAAERVAPGAGQHCDASHPDRGRQDALGTCDRARAAGRACGWCRQPVYGGRHAADDRIAALRGAGCGARHSRPLARRTGGPAVFPDVLASGDAAVRAVLVTDGVADLLPPAETETLSVFQPADNVGITAFDLRAVPGDRRRYQAFVKVLNASPGAKQVELRVAGVGRPSIARVLDIPGGAASSEIFDVSAFDGGPLRASISARVRCARG